MPLVYHREKQADAVTEVPKSIMDRIAVIEEILENWGKMARIRISEKIFHPAGGGQPGDSGIIEGSEFMALVRNSHQDPDGDVLTIEVQEGELVKGISVNAHVDESRHLRLSRMHTGEHILSRCLERDLDGLSVQKVLIGEKESIIYTTFPGEIDWESLFRAEEESNRLIDLDLPVTRKELPRNEVEKLEGVKFKWDRLEEGVISVISIENFDSIACSGSHVASTGVVGGVIVTGFKGAPPDWEVRFSIDRDAVLLRQSRIIRVLLRNVGCEENVLPVFIRKLQEDKKDMEKKIEKAGHFIELPWEKLPGTSIPAFFLRMENFPQDLATPSLKKLLKRHPESLVLFLSPFEEEGRSSFILAAGERSKVDLRNFLKSSPFLDAKGGCFAGWVQGIAGCSSREIWKKAIDQAIEKTVDK